MSAVGIDWTYNPIALQALPDWLKDHLRSQAEYAEDRGMLRDDVILHIAGRISGRCGLNDDDAIAMAEHAFPKPGSRFQRGLALAEVLATFNPS